MLPTSWKPLPVELIRLGNPNEGGYLVSPQAVRKADFLLSMGLSDDWGFEEDFRAINPVPVICFDHTVTARFWVRNALGYLSRRQPLGAFRYLAYRRFFQGNVRQ